MILADGQVNRIDHHAVPRSCFACVRVLGRLQEPLVIIRVMAFVETGGQAEVAEFDVAFLITGVKSVRGLDT